jgi:hypothetical protein
VVVLAWPTLLALLGKLEDSGDRRLDNRAKSWQDVRPRIWKQLSGRIAQMVRAQL